MARVLVEACVETVAGCRAAERAGADRIELCAHLEVGGTTPSDGLVAAARDATTLPLFVLVRPRGGDFVYADDELAVLARDVERARERGADGIVLGVLDAERRVAGERMRALLDRAAPLPVTFHRAFDAARDPDEALHARRAPGVARVLTSGGAATAAEGAASLAHLVRRAAGAPIVLAGGGVRARNVAALVARSGVREVHLSARSSAPDGRAFTDEAELRATVDALHGMLGSDG